MSKEMLTAEMLPVLAQSIPSDWTAYLISMCGVFSVITWFMDLEDFTNLEWVYNLIRAEIIAVENKTNLVQAFIDNGFVHTNLQLDITTTHAYLTEYLRTVLRILNVFGELISLMEDFGLDATQAERIYMALDNAISGLVDLYHQIETHMNLDLSLSLIHPVIGN